MQNIIHLIYNSAATKDFSNEELTELLARARNNNASLGITGILLHIEGSFFQILEGPEAAVNALFEKIRADSRHTRVTVIIREPISIRSFSEWTMGFTRISNQDVSEVDGFNDFFEEGGTLSTLDSGRAQKLLMAFRQGRWRAQLSTQLPRNASLAQSKGRVPAHHSAESRPKFSFAFQPVIDAERREISGYEALVRGPSQEPSTQILQHIPLGEIPAFDEDARRMAVGLASRIGLTGNLHLNFLPQTRLVVPQTLDSTLQTAARCGIGASRLVLEIKHEASISDAVELAAWLQKYRLTGLRVCIDDFGAAHAGLALLEHYQPDLISINMALVRGIESHGPRQAIMRGIMQVCGDLGIDIIAKGIETADEFFWLREEGLKLFQGFLFSKPGFETFPRPIFPADPN